MRGLNLIGKEFGMLLVLGVSKEAYIDPKNGYRYKKWDCKCKCGNIIAVRTSDLRRKNGTKSCGCTRLSNMISSNTTHGDTGTRLYNIWKNIIKRCENKNCKSYSDYGGRGIIVCKEWRNDYMAFKSWALKNGYQNQLTIDRINNDGNYSPDNCRWVGRKKQNNNTRRNNTISANGETHTLSEWSEITGLNYSTLRNRKNVLHWDDNKIINTPVSKKNERK